MSECSNCYNGCTEPVSDKCVKYTGIDVPELGIETGDTLSFVESSIINFLVPVLNGVGVKPIIPDSIICTVVRQYLPTCTICIGFTLNDVLSAIIKAACDLQEQVDSIVAELAILNADYTIGCLTGVTSSSDTHAIVQAIINKLCTVSSELDLLLINLPNTYVPINSTLGNPGINDYIESYLANNGSANTISSKMVPYAVLPYFGPIIGIFDSTGAGLNLTTSGGKDWRKIYLCNGNNNTPDIRGRALTGAIVNVPGPTLNASVNPAASPANPNYSIYDTVGANQISLSETQLPLHVHPNVLNFNDPQHSHPIGPTGGPTGGGVLSPQTLGTTTYQFQNANTNNTPLQSTFVTMPVSTGITATISNVAGPVGGGLPHSNIQPVIACYYIQYRP